MYLEKVQKNKGDVDMNYKTIGSTILVSSLLLGACGANEAKETTKNQSETTAKTAKKEEKKVATNALKDNTAVLNDIDVKVLETEFIPKGTYEYQKKDQLAIIYEVKNKTNKEIDPINGWLAVFEGTQDSKNAVRKLEVGMLPDMDKYKFALDTQMDIIKKGGTVKNAIAYDLEDTKTPVILTATKGIGGEKLGEIKVNIKK